MFEKNEKPFQETESAFAVTVLLLNASVLTVTFGIGWLAYWLVNQSSQLESFIRVVQTN